MKSAKSWLSRGDGLEQTRHDGLGIDALGLRLEVDEHAVAVIRYAFGLSKSETRWGTFTDPWTHQPQPKCGFVIKGTDGTISCYDYEPTIRVQTRANPEGFDVKVDEVKAPNRNPIEHVIHCLETGSPLIGPLSLEIFNDQFRGGASKTIAADGHRSLVYLMDQVARHEPAIAIAAPAMPPRMARP